MATLREKLSNPFTGDDLFFLNVVADGTILSPASSDRVVQKWARVDIKNGRPNLTVNYDSYISYENRVAVKDVKVIGKDGEIIPSTYKYNKNNYSGILSFELPYIPDGGEFNTEFTDFLNQKHESKLILDYSTITKGMLPELLSIAIDKYDKYLTDDFSTYGKISEDKKDDYTEYSFKKFIEILNKCKYDLEPEHRSELTQDLIDEDILNLRNARENLKYKIASKIVNNVNIGVEALNSPANYYEDSEKHAMPIGWIGSKIKFNDGTYKILNTGKRYNYEKSKEEETGKLLIMADDFNEKQPWIKQKSSKIIRWDESFVRKYLNDEFYNKFNNIQKSLITDSILYTSDAMDMGVGISAVHGKKLKTKDKIFIADLSMMKSADFGFMSEDARTMGRIHITRNLVKGAYDENVNKILTIKSQGKIEGLGQNEDFTEEVDFYPCMNIDKSKIFMTIADDADISYLNSVDTTDNNVWRMVLRDNSINPATGYKVDGREVTINGDNLYAAIIRGDLNNGKVRYFGKVDNKFEIPEFKKDKDKLYIFNAKDVKSELILSEGIEVPINADLSYVAPKKPEKQDKKDKNEDKKIISKIYTMDATMIEKGKSTDSMSNVMFTQKVDIEVKGNDAILKFYLAYPVPAFPTLGVDGSVKDFYIEYKGQKYIATSDITTKPLKEVKKTHTGFGLKKGALIPMQILTVVLPKDVIKNGTKLAAGCYVNVVMNRDVQLDISLNNLTFVKDVYKRGDVKVNETDKKEGLIDSKIDKGQKNDKQVKKDRKNPNANTYIPPLNFTTDELLDNNELGFISKKQEDKNKKEDKKEAKKEEKETKKQEKQAEKEHTKKESKVTIKEKIKLNKDGISKVDAKILENVKTDTKKLTINVESKENKVNVYLNQDVLKKLSSNGLKDLKLNSPIGKVSLNKKAIKMLSKLPKGVNILLSKENGNYAFKVTDTKNKQLNVNKLKIKVSFR